MTEDEWRASRHGQRMLDFVRTATVSVRTRWLGWKAARRFRVSERKVRLVEAACCERIVELLPAPYLGQLVDIAREHAEGVAGLLEYDFGHVARLLIEENWDISASTPAALLALGAVRGLFAPAKDDPAAGVLEAAARARAEAFAASRPSGVYERLWHQAHAGERAAQADLVRDVIGNLIRPERIEPSWLLANDRAAVRIAEGGRFADLPILADALEDAGCDVAPVLDHCRGPGPHVQGCWVVDLVLGKE